MESRAFRRTVQTHFRRHGRHDLPWRQTTDPYHILVSEIMLQQTQVSRVTGFYRTFLRAFPTFRALARASTGDVLKAWQGLGYNRRALMLHRCARTVVRDHAGHLPQDYDALCALPGIGSYTAGAILAFAFDRPWPVIETNIRRVYLHHYFPRCRKVSDARLMPLIAEHVAAVRSPRRWYSALMDYGTALAAAMPNPNRRSRHYARQPGFDGSVRQLRGRILRRLTRSGPVRRAALAGELRDPRLSGVLRALEREGFVRVSGTTVRLAG